MAFINVVIGEKVEYLNVEKEQLKLTLINKEVRHVNISDINSIIIENNQITISSYLLSRLSTNNVVVYFCDEKHLPNSILIPFNSYFAQLRIYKYQTKASKPLQKNIWQKIIKQKIKNQAKCLEILGVKDFERLYILETLVASGDKGNVEANAAQLYFKMLMGKGFRRNENLFFNQAINYGYSLIRGLIARSIVSYGLQPYLGIHHFNELNAFNLADDFIEPFRPYVDLFVTQTFNIESEELKPNDKKVLMNILNSSIKIKGQNHSLQNSINILIESFIDSIKTNENKIQLPELLGIKKYEFE